MNRYTTKAIILRRVDYGEADRVITFITPDYGKVAVMAKGVRREKSKLAGGIELFSETDVTIIDGRGSLGILGSARLIKFYKNIMTDYARVTAGYDVIKQVNDLIEDDAGGEFYELLNTALRSLDDLDIPVSLTEAWYRLNILKLMGSEPDLHLDDTGKKLDADSTYIFDVREGSFIKDSRGKISSAHIKTWRLLLTQLPDVVAKVQGVQEAIDESGEQINSVYVNIL